MPETLRQGGTACVSVPRWSAGRQLRRPGGKSQRGAADQIPGPCLFRLDPLTTRDLRALQHMSSPWSSATC